MSSDRLQLAYSRVRGNWNLETWSLVAAKKALLFKTTQVNWSRLTLNHSLLSKWKLKSTKGVRSKKVWKLKRHETHHLIS